MPPYRAARHFPAPLHGYYRPPPTIPPRLHAACVPALYHVPFLSATPFTFHSAYAYTAPCPAYTCLPPPAWRGGGLVGCQPLSTPFIYISSMHLYPCRLYRNAIRHTHTLTPYTRATLLAFVPPDARPPHLAHYPAFRRFLYITYRHLPPPYSSLPTLSPTPCTTPLHHYPMPRHGTVTHPAPTHPCAVYSACGTGSKRIVHAGAFAGPAVVRSAREGGAFARSSIH